MKGAKKRGARLSEDDLALWRKVADRTEKLDLGDLFAPAPQPIPFQQPQPPVPQRMNGVTKPAAATPKKVTQDLRPSLVDQFAQAPVKIDKRVFSRLKRGKLTPEARLDLHGMTLDRAHPALNRFVMNAYTQGKRLVLVITGKGKNRDEGGPIPVRHGVLRHQVPQWLSLPPLSSVVLQVTPSHQSHGGAGAYYVYLKRHR